MTDLTDPLDANCFIVGKNQRNRYPVGAVDHVRHVNALFNRNGESCRALYEELCEPSPTRKNTDRLSGKLKAAGARVLETNVICFSSPMSSDLTRIQKQKGSAIFEWLLARLQPKVIIVHGEGAARALSKVATGKAIIIRMPSLAPPAYQKWHFESEKIMNETVSAATAALA
ncbi:hypothetical protein Pden_2582 [Paracoccus denitrificans PD1222]|uniref:Uracil-DNA glycosylase-like domain-containing protein n=2 Tax=Paracoccus denitrificans TaxID=266 RepID=A1B575_PARDP|nr:hypothetical protein Pden_2582 [Paracoccus denitrificans PD1222]